MLRRIWFALAIALLVSAWPADSRAEPRDSMIIVDGSNSMWARVEGRSKIEHAYGAIAKAVRAAPKDARIGLMAFGYRSRRNCQDITVLVRPATGTANRISKSVQRVKPRGRAPITGALLRASRELKSKNHPQKIVLLTDGRDNCRGDPCALARRLGTQRKSLSVDVIAFAFADRSTKNVACIAKATGGRFVKVDTAADLEAELRASVAPEPPPEPEVIAETEKAPAKPEETAEADEAPAKPEETVETDEAPAKPEETTETGRAPLETEDSPPVAADTPEPERGKSDRRPGPQTETATSQPAPKEDAAPDGRPAATDSGEREAADELSVAAIPPGAVPVPPRQAPVVQPDETRVAALPGATVPVPPRLDLVRPSAPAEVAAPVKPLPPLGPATAALLRPGKAQIRPLLVDRASALDRAAIVRRTVAPLLSPSPGDDATLTLRAALTDDSPPLAAGLRWLVHELKANGKRATRLAAKSSLAQPRFKLESGRYVVVARLGTVEVESKIAIDAASPVEATVVLNAGILRVHGAPTGPASGEAVYSLLTAAKGKRGRLLDQASGPVGVFYVPAGAYRVIGRLGLARDLKPVKVKPGAVVDLSLALDRGFLKLVTVGKKRSKPLGGLTYSVYELAAGDEDEAREVARSRAGRPLLALPPGRYRVVVRNGRRHTSREVRVRAGELTSQILSLNAGTLKLASRLTGRGDDLTSGFSYRILSGGRDRQGRRREIIGMSALSNSIDLPAGTYRVESLYGDVNALASADVEIKAGGLTDLTLEHRAGVVKPVLVHAAGGTALPGVSWTLMDGNGKELKRTTEAAPVFKLAAGSYRLRALREGQRQLVEFSVATGDELTIEVLSEDSSG